MTNTEQLLIEAKEICQRTTGREEVGDELLCAVFQRLELETDLASQDDEDDAIGLH